MAWIWLPSLPNGKRSFATGPAREAWAHGALAPGKRLHLTRSPATAVRRQQAVPVAHPLTPNRRSRIPLRITPTLARPRTARSFTAYRSKGRPSASLPQHPVSGPRRQSQQSNSCIKSSRENSGRNRSPNCSARSTSTLPSRTPSRSAGRPRLYLLRPARYRQNHSRAHSGPLPELHRGLLLGMRGKPPSIDLTGEEHRDATRDGRKTQGASLRRVRQLPRGHRRKFRRRYRD